MTDWPPLCPHGKRPHVQDRCEPCEEAFEKRDAALPWHASGHYLKGASGAAIGRVYGDPAKAQLIVEAVNARATDDAVRVPKELLERVCGDLADLRIALDGAGVPEVMGGLLSVTGETLAQLEALRGGGE